MVIKEHMEVIGADGVHVGTVDNVEGGRIKLTKKDSGEGAHKGHHHYISGVCGRSRRRQGAPVCERRCSRDDGTGRIREVGLNEWFRWAASLFNHQ